LKRCVYEQVTLEQFFIGSVLNIFSRQMKIKDYAD
jgi:hypothetical protein